MKYIPHTQAEIKSMLSALDVSSIEDILPAALKKNPKIDFPKPHSEIEIQSLLNSLAVQNEVGFDNFLGAGAYRHYIPEIVGVLSSRSEFATAYTPYQPEASQGTLQSLFEFQTMMADLCGMEIANASMYEGATACAEAILMALRIHPPKNKVLIGKNIHPRYQATCLSYLKDQNLEIQFIDYDQQSGCLDLKSLKAHLDRNTACVLIQSPNYFGIVESAMQEISNLIQKNESLCAVAIADPTSLGLFEPPGNFGVHIVVGEAQSFGNPVSFGGPYVGFFATRKEFVRQIPGRIVGESVDLDGKRAFTLTLSTREQHIRREKATSNICTNQNLCALRSTIYLSTMGPAGLKETAGACYSKTQYAKELFSKIKGVSIRFSGTAYNEFVYSTSKNMSAILSELQKHKIFGGVGTNEGILVCCTELNTKEQIHRYTQTLESLL
ncbi:MAG: aminomethyl-transferring glycine dehydrogenase subunit GcvPA [Deltaproteobacteria bacterium]|nr:aminomethyl-transferring glycine dehydrogenase subunit GcvPA [Deltaproteobacteria bacterium]